jgi:hypothetical protein
MKYVNESTGQVTESRDFWALVDAGRESGNRLSYFGGAFRAQDGTWYRPEDMTLAELTEHQDVCARDQWWAEHKRDTSVIPGLSDSDLMQFRLLADIRADMPVLNAATDELWRREIFDYPIAI